MKKNVSGMHRVTPWAMGPVLGLLLSGCGGGEDGSSAAPAATPSAAVGSASGVFSDAAVQGLAFSTSSGVTGTTDALGRYTYNPGDTISFKLGSLGLGSTAASALVTPVDLAEGSANRLQNLLVLLQSLDDDGQPANGIKISAAAAAAATTGIDLAQAPAGFASAANTGLVAAMAAAGIGRAITTAAVAQAHFVEQAKTLLSSQVWVGSYDNGAGVFVQRFGMAGEHLGAQFGPAEDGGSSGMEYSNVLATAVDARGFKIERQTQIDTNGAWGFTALSACERLQVVGESLRYLEAGANCVTSTTTTLNKAENDPKGIVGVWALGSATRVKTQTFVFWANGKYAMLDPIGDTEASACGGPGVEYGSYSYDAASKTLKVLGVTVDTNGCAGLHESGQPLTSLNVALSSDGSSANVNSGEDTLYRVSK